MVSTATDAVLLDNAAFARMVTEEGLRMTELGGYVYAGKQGKNGWELYRTYGPKWRYLYQARRVNTQNNAGGGALETNIVIASGITAELVDMFIEGAASAGSTLTVQVEDEDGTLAGLLGYTAAGASRTNTFPSIGTTAQHGNAMHSLQLKLGPGQTLSTKGSAALQTETHTVYIALLLPITAASDGSDVTWNTTGSAGTPSLAASTISAANTMQAVLLP